MLAFSFAQYKRNAIIVPRALLHFFFLACSIRNVKDFPCHSIPCFSPFTLPHSFNITCSKTENDSIELLPNTCHRKEDGSKTMQRTFTIARAGSNINFPCEETLRKTTAFTRHEGS